MCTSIVHSLAFIPFQFDGSLRDEAELPSPPMPFDGALPLVD
jgi:hypothetical protein